MSRYSDWLRAQGIPVYTAAGRDWRRYRGALVPVNDVPLPVELGPREAARLLAASRTWLLRYPGELLPDQGLDEGWYYILADTCHDLAELPKKVRYEVRQGRAHCHIERVSPAWLAAHGYDCYLAAHTRYAGALPMSHDRFEHDLQARAAGPFEAWAVFAGAALAGYSICIVDDGVPAPQVRIPDSELRTPAATREHHSWVHHSVAKYDPAHLGARSAYALVRHLLEEYPGRRRLCLVNGTRSIAHDTQYNRLLVKLGFRPVHCRLMVRYSPLLAPAVRLAWAARGVMRRLSLAPLRAMLELESLRRAEVPAHADG